MPRLQHSYHNHYSDQIYDSGAPVGSIIAVYVDHYSKNAGSTVSSNCSYNHPGYLYCDGANLNIADFPLLYEVIGNKYGGTDPNSVDLRNYGGTLPGTFKLPDLRMKRINGPGGVNGPGSLTPDDSSMEVGDMGGEWYISRARQLNEYSFGSVRISGYTNVVGFVSGQLTGTATVKIGPLEPKALNGPPPHTHLVMCSERDERQSMDAGTAATGDNTTNYDTGAGQIVAWSPEEMGYSAEHTHYISEYRPTRGKTEADGAMYSYDLSPTYAHEQSGGNQQEAIGQSEYVTPGSYSWICPTGVTEVDVVCIGGGGGGAGGTKGGGGGGLGYKNSISVTPGSSYPITIGTGGTGGADNASGHHPGGDSYFINRATVCGYGAGSGNDSNSNDSSQGGIYSGDGGGNGGPCTSYGGGGGAAGYAGNGGSTPNGGDAPTLSGGGGAGCDSGLVGHGAGGGGVGLQGKGADGTGGGTQATPNAAMNGGTAGSTDNHTSQGAGTNSNANFKSAPIKTENWVRVTVNNSGGTGGGVYTNWTTFMQQHAIYPTVPGNPASDVDPYLGNAQTGGQILDIGSGLGYPAQIEVACDNTGTLTWTDPSGTQLLSTNFSATSTSTPSTVHSLGTLAEGRHVISWTIENTSVANNAWIDNPAGVAWKVYDISDNQNPVGKFSTVDCTGGNFAYGSVYGGNGGDLGGGAGACFYDGISNVTGGNGGHGGVRVIWGSGRSFPSSAADQTPQDFGDAGTSDAYTNAYGANKINENDTNDRGETVSFVTEKTLSVTPAQAGITLNEGTMTMTGAEQLEVSASIVPRTAVPLVLKYFRVKYLIKAY